jgi:hypothetical protein
MLTVLTPPSDSNPSPFAADMLRLEQDIVAGQMQREAQQIREWQRIQRQDDCRCRGCGDPTDGLTICGQQVQVCPACFDGFVATRDCPTVASV